MTAPQPAALPELPEPDIHHHMMPVWRNDVECEVDLGPRYTADQMRAYALATLQAQQSTQGDTPAAAEVSDVIAMVRERYRGTKWGKAAECICDAVDEAILALRPQAVPMTEEQIDAMTASIFGAGTLDVEEIHAVREVVRTVEAHHGITAQGAQGGEG